jgi:hypothetical protein
MPSLSFTQSIVSTNTNSIGTEYFPGQANIWTLDQDFAVVNDQFNYGLWLLVGGPTGTEFPADQLYTDLTFYTPFTGASEGIKAAAVSDGLSMNLSPITGHSAFLNATADSRLQQTLSLPAGTFSVRWSDDVYLPAPVFFGYVPNHQVVVRRLDGTLLKTLYTYNFGLPGTRSSGFTLATPTTVVLSFEESSSTSWFDEARVIIDSVSVKDASSLEYVVNGDFENGMTGWNVSTPAEIQNITSGPGPTRTIGGLDVKRSFYTVPDKLWARWVDVFENKTGSQITTTISYDTDLGSTGSGVIYFTPGTTNKALTSWDSAALTGDIGLVFGNAASAIFTSATGTVLGSEFITVSYSIIVPAGGRVAIVNFALMSGTDTGLTAIDVDAKATEIDTEAANIVNNFWTDWQYRKGMTQEQIDAIINFAH